MKERVIPPSGNELFMSIGMQVTYELEVDVDDDDLEDDDDDDREEVSCYDYRLLLVWRKPRCCNCKHA